MSLALFFAQHVSNASTFIFRSLRLCVCVYCSVMIDVFSISVFVCGECLVVGFLLCSVF